MPTFTVRRRSAPLIFAAALTFAPLGGFAASSGTQKNGCPYTWTQNLKVGSVGDDVLKLQQFLNASPDTQITLSGAGSPGQETKRYGALTAKAVARFQEKYKDEILSPAGLTKGTGAVLKQTRLKLNALCKETPVATEVKEASASTASIPALTSADVLTIESPEQPAPTIAPANAGSVPFTNITLTAGSKDVTVKSLTIERTGAGMDGAFYDISLYNENGDTIEEGKSFRSDHRVEAGTPFVIPAYSSTTISIMGNMNSDLSNYGGQRPALHVVAINASSPLAGELPVRGTAQTINSNLTIGGASAALSQYDPATAANRYINDKNIRFSGIRITAHAEEPLRLGSIAWDQVGTAGENDIENVVTVVNDVSYPTTLKGKLYTSTFDPQVMIPKGQTIDVYVQGDLKVSGANRTVRFNIRKSAHIWLIGNSYGFDVGISPESSTATEGNSVFITSDGTVDGDEGNPFFSGSVTTINGGSFTNVGKATN